MDWGGGAEGGAFGVSRAGNRTPMGGAFAAGGRLALRRGGEKDRALDGLGGSCPRLVVGSAVTMGGPWSGSSTIDVGGFGFYN
jgi:hypothetical protein